MANFSNITNVKFPRNILQEAFDFLRKAGESGYEAVVLFAGTAEKNIYIIQELYIPQQTSYKTPEGLMYQVDQEELFKLDDWLYDNNLSLFCQMHTHPGEAYHSKADDRNCIVTTTGGISVVIPDFAKANINLSIWAVYRLVHNSGWRIINRETANTFIEIF